MKVTNTFSMKENISDSNTDNILQHENMKTMPISIDNSLSELNKNV